MHDYASMLEYIDLLDSQRALSIRIFIGRYTTNGLFLDYFSLYY
jgi:hypothetical protein